MPHAFLLHLIPTKPVAKHPYLHQYTHGLFYALLAMIDPDLSAEVHAATRNPFTLWARERRDGSVLLRVTTLDDALFKPLVGAVLQTSLTGLELGCDNYRIAQVLATPEGHRDAAYQPWHSLLESEPVASLSFKFLTPTVFSTSRNKRRSYTPLPIPQLMTRSLLRAFQTYCPHPYSPTEAAALEAAFEQDLVVSRHDIHTRLHLAGKTTLGGFLGRVSLRYKGATPQVKRALGRLAALAFYSGIGAKSPYGMGQVRAVAKGERSKPTAEVAELVAG